MNGTLTQDVEADFKRDVAEMFSAKSSNFSTDSTWFFSCRT